MTLAVTRSLIQGRPHPLGLGRLPALANVEGRT